MTQINGGELVVRTLRRAGVEVAFGLHGAHIDSIFQASLDQGLPIIDARHEVAAGHAAEGYARAASRLGVALVTAGGGFTNVVTSIANAFQDRTPVLYLTGSGPLRDDETNTLQAGIDQVAIAKPVTKWAHRVQTTEHIPRLVAQAIRIAQSAPRGPVLLDLPWDILTRQIAEESAPIPEINSPPRGAAADGADLEAILELLSGAERPAIVLGSEAKRARAVAEPALASLVKSTGIPVFADYEGLSLLSPLGEVGADSANGGLLQGLYGFAEHGAAPDVLLLLGLRFGLNSAHGSGSLLPHTARIVQVDPDARELGRLQQISLGVTADVGATLDGLAGAAARRSWPDRRAWRARVGELVQGRRDRVARACPPSAPMHPFEATEIVGRFIDQDTAVVADGALTYLWLSEVISASRPAEFLCHGFFGSMGVGFGTAVGCEYAMRDAGKRTILVTGDGSLGYSLSEFDTLVRHGLPAIVVVMNNRSWGATQHFQRVMVGPNRITNTLLENGAYHDVARALGADGYYATDAASLEAALRAALANPRPACIDVRVALEPIPPEERVVMGQDPF